MAKTIMSHRVTRGSLVHQVQDVQFPQLKQALCAASAANALQLQAQRMAVLAAQIRRIRRHRNGKDILLAVEDQYIFQRPSGRQAREYRRPDSDDAEIVRLRLMRSRIVANVRAGVQS
jgi:hypothetical protein